MHREDLDQYKAWLSATSKEYEITKVWETWKLSFADFHLTGTFRLKIAIFYLEVDEGCDILYVYETNRNAKVVIAEVPLL